LGKALKNEDPVYRVEAALALWRILNQPRAIDFLAAMIDETDSPGSFEAVVALGEVGPEAISVSDSLVAALDHAEPDVRRATADVLSGLGPKVIETVAGRIQQGSLRQPAPAAYVLGQVLADLRESVFYQDGVDQATFESAAGPVMRSAAPALVSLMSDSREAIRQSASRSLAQAGLLAMPFLLDLLVSDNRVARQAAIETLVRVESCLPPSAVSSEPIDALLGALLDRLMQRMRHADPHVRAAAFRAFATMSPGETGQPAMPLLRKALKDENLAVRRYAAQAIRDLGGDD
jgi:HEAT repeat protein